MLSVVQQIASAVRSSHNFAIADGRRIRSGCQRHCEAQLLTEDKNIDVGSMREIVAVYLVGGR